jgi:hypothetical protein
MEKGIVFSTTDAKTNGHLHVTTSMGQTLHHCDKIPDINNLREETFILVHGFRGFVQSGLLVLGLC